MGNTTTSVIIDNHDLQLAKSKNINISEVLRNALQIELYLEDKEARTKDEQISLLRKQIIDLKGQLVLKEDEIENLKKQIPKVKESFEI